MAPKTSKAPAAAATATAADDLNADGTALGAILTDAVLNADGTDVEIPDSDKTASTGNTDGDVPDDDETAAEDSPEYIVLKGNSVRHDGETYRENTAITVFARELLAQNNAAGVLTKLGLGNVVRDTRTINGKRLNEDITLTAAELGIGQATESTPGIVQISDTINANDSRVAASSAAVYKLLPKRAYTDNDFIRVPDTSGGLMIQWGRLQSGEGANFSTPFTNACRFCIVIPQNGSSGPFDMAYLYTRSYDKQGFLRSAATSGTPCFWLAIGY